jgi:DNA-binding GntR family transcriptional regulator
MTSPERAPKTGATVDRVVDTILTRIGAGELGPGEQLRQEDLAEALGVSRVPVREALHALAEQRVLVHLKHRGFFVAKRSPDELTQFARLLELIEDEVVATVRWPDDDVVAELRELNQRMLDVADDYDTTETFTLNRTFHFRIFTLSPLSVMIDELERLWRLAQPYIVSEMVTGDARRHRVEEHQRIIDRLEARDLEGLIEAMRHHRRRGSGRTRPRNGRPSATVPASRDARVSAATSSPNGN